MIALHRRRLLGAAAAVLAAPALIGRARAATALKVSTSFPNDPNFSTARIWYDLFLPQLKEATDGAVTTQFFPDNQLGQEADVVNQVKMGVVDIMLVGTPIWTNVVPECGVFDLGYVFQDYDHLRRASADPGGRRAAAAAGAEGRRAFPVLGPQSRRAQLPDQVQLQRPGRARRQEDPLACRTRW